MKRVFGIAGWKNAGKTTLTVRLVEYLTGQGFSVSTVKHAHHTAAIDHEGTDSYRHRQAGAREVMLVTPSRFALMHELRGGEDEPVLEELLDRMAEADLILVEGYKRDSIPKLMILRDGDSEADALEELPNIEAFVYREPNRMAESEKPAFVADDIQGIAAFMVSRLGLKT
jgi:molybdopterin-guanine dinucleotide biosynthesis protein MobB